jgi:predicted nucleic acid-binding protein
MSKEFIDTNILVYSVDGRDPEKKKRSREVLRRLADEGTGVLSTQVLQEFFVAATRRLGSDPLVAREIMNDFSNFETVTVTHAIINEAVDVSVLNRISFWDSLIVASAASAACSVVLSEDLNSGQRFKGLVVVNPFV